MSVRRALVVAGLDPSAGAGLVLDAFVLAGLGYLPTTVASMVTAQNSAMWVGAEAVSPQLVAEQIDAVLADGPVACVKVGAIGSAAVASILAEKLAVITAPVVLDPVLASSSEGDLTGGAGATAIEILARLASVVTPNAAEACALAGESDPHVAGRTLAERWGTSVVVTGLPVASPHAAADLVCTPEGSTELEHALVSGVGDVRGTGCAFSSAVAGYLGVERSLPDAVAGAQAEVIRLLSHSVAAGPGRRQIDLASLPASSQAGRLG